jgi:hypothetical protein
MRKAVFIVALVLTIAACTTSYTATDTRQPSDDLTSFGNLSYTVNHTAQNTSYIVTILKPRTASTGHEATIENNTLRITTESDNPRIIVPAQVSGTVTGPRPDQILIDDAGQTNQATQIDWEQAS